MLVNDVDIVIITHPGHRRESLRALLKSASWVDAVYEVDDYPVIPMIISSKPHILVLFDSTLSREHTRTGIAYLKQKFPNIFCIALIEQPKYEDILSSAGADVVMLDNFTADDLLNAVQNFNSP
jgi:DNA-binding NarL/FixJ family response regulator